MNNIKSAWLTTNYSCNCKCDWCYAKNEQLEKRTLNINYAKELVKYLYSKGIKTITLIGGEPTLYPWLLELINYIKSFNTIKIRIATNGISFKNIDFSKKIVASGVNGINISIKGCSNDEYICQAHCNNGFSNMLLGYKNLTKLGLRPSISYVITSSNIDEFNSLINLIKHNKMDNLILQFEKPSLNLENVNSTMDIKDMANFINYIIPILEKAKINYTIEVSFPLCLIDEKELHFLISNKRISSCCHLQKGVGIVFDVNGYVLPCNHFCGFPINNQPFDVLNENSLENLINSNKFKKLENTVKRYPSLKCKDCSLWKICGGGCFTRWFYINPNDYI